jgi:hypothetical protein
MAVNEAHRLTDLDTEKARRKRLLAGRHRPDRDP